MSDPHTAKEYFYRYEDKMYCGVDEWDSCHSFMRVELREFPLLKTTPNGAWIDVWGNKRFVLAGARKRFACPTVEEAKASFKRRKEVQISIYRKRIEKAERAIRICCGGDTSMTMDPHTAKLHRRLAAECSVPDGMLLSGMEEGEVERNMRIIRGNEMLTLVLPAQQGGQQWKGTTISSR